MNSFIKQISEQYTIAVEWADTLPSGTALVSGTVAAVNSADGSDATSTVLDSATATISGTQARAFVKGGADGITYKLTFLVDLTPGTPVPRLEEDLFMLVRAL